MVLFHIIATIVFTRLFLSSREYLQHHVVVVKLPPSYLILIPLNTQWVSEEIFGWEIYLVLVHIHGVNPIAWKLSTGMHFNHRESPPAQFTQIYIWPISLNINESRHYGFYFHSHTPLCTDIIRRHIKSVKFITGRVLYLHFQMSLVWGKIRNLMYGVFCGKMWQLVSRDGHFRGLILCNAKCLQFHQNKKQENRDTVQQVFYSPMSSFFNFWSCWFRLRWKFLFLIVTAPLSFFMVAG